MMKAGLMKIVHEVRKNAGIHSKALVKTVPAVCVGACMHVYVHVCDEVNIIAVKNYQTSLVSVVLLYMHIYTEICQPPCVYGTCDVNTGYCDCNPGYTGLSCSEGEVVTV